MLSGDLGYCTLNKHHNVSYEVQLSLKTLSYSITAWFGYV